MLTMMIRRVLAAWIDYCSSVIGGDKSDRLIPVPHSSAPTDQAIRVVKAFQAGLDRREPSLSGPSAARLREISRQLKLQVEHEGKGVPRADTKCHRYTYQH
uniref:ATP_Ca_trans_C domain-containing protein n=1 Tax=Steinernema glaseri TaxID=37863 RepID=A0A1I7Y137_9BILA